MTLTYPGGDLELKELLLKAVRMLDPSTGSDCIADILLSNGKIAGIGRGIPVTENVEVFDASGLWLFPGLVDMHAHLREPGDEMSETVESGLRAALAGGVTAVGVMPNTRPAMDTVDEVLSLRRKADGRGLAKAVPIPAVTIGRHGKEPVDIEALGEAGVRAFSDDGDPVYDSGILRDALERAAEFDGVIIEHPEDKTLSGGSINLGSVSEELNLRGIPPEAETADVARCMEIACASRGRLHLTHLSLPRSVLLARADCFSCARVTVDVTPHHIALDESAVIRHGTMAKMNPPLRTPEQRMELADLVASGMVDAVASDHAPHRLESKLKPIEEAAFGIAGLETLLPITLEVLSDHGMDACSILRLLTTGPAGVLSIPQPCLQKGGEANCVLFDPDEEYTLADKGSLSYSSNTPFLRRTIRGRVKAVWMGELVYTDVGFGLSDGPQMLKG